MNWLAAYYPWIKALHIMAVIAWMAGLFYLPRLFVYHAERADNEGPLHELFGVMESRLLGVIMHPAMIAAWGFGLALVAIPGVVDWSMTWPWIKAAGVFGMTAFHYWLAASVRRFANGGNRLTGRQYRMMNEVPTLLMVVIVVSVVVKF